MQRREAIKKTAALMGGVIFAPTILGVLNGCTATGGQWRPVLFNRSQAELTKALAETIIPETDTPGALEAGVPGFIEKMVHEAYNKQQQASFLNGLDQFNRYCLSSTGNIFSELSTDERLGYAIQMNRSAIEKETADGVQFFLIFKELTLIGYFTSEVGATQVLRYNPVPGYFDGCIPFDEGERAWAT